MLRTKLAYLPPLPSRPVCFRPWPHSSRLFAYRFANTFSKLVIQIRNKNLTRTDDFLGEVTRVFSHYVN